MEEEYEYLPEESAETSADEFREEESEEAAPEDTQEENLQPEETAEEETGSNQEEVAAEEDLPAEEEEAAATISGNDLEMILEKYSVSGNDLDENMNEIQTLLSESGDIYSQSSAEVVEACNAIDRDVVTGFTATSILLGLIAGILLVDKLAEFLKGV